MLKGLYFLSFAATWKKQRLYFLALPLFLVILLNTLIACRQTPKREARAGIFAAKAADRLAECCSPTGAYEITHRVLNIESDKKHKQFIISLEISWKESKFGLGQRLKGQLHVDFDGCHPQWQHKSGDLVSDYTKGWKDCLVGCLDES